jgi:hypothetical protein
MTHVLHQHPFTPYDREPSTDLAHFRAMPMMEEMLPVEMNDEFRHRIGAKPLDLANWLPRDAETEPTIAMKRELLATRRDEVVALHPGGEAAAEEAAQLVAEFCGVTLTTHGIDALVEASLLVADDLTVLAPVGDQLLFVAGVVCSPSRWKLASKMGTDMLATHQPVSRYAEHIGAAVDTTLRRLTPNKAIWRSNWTLEDHCALFQPVSPTAPLVDDPSLLWIRMERETLRRLPETGGVLFTIRGFQQPLPDYVARGTQHARTLRSLVARLPDDVARYKSVYAYRDSVLEWLEPHCAA